MIRGIGIDLVDVQRFKGVMERCGKRFIERVFTEEEIRYCKGKHKPHIYFAARFASKEAVIKAVGKTIPFRDIEVLKEEGGRPLLNVKGYDKKEGYNWHLSITHDGQYSAAHAIMEVDIETG
jgi:holo-[acyl-carrier protein] synthase